jgi:hypothetical protein
MWLRVTPAFVMTLMTACSSTTTGDAGVDGALDGPDGVASEVSTGPIASGCVGSLGGGRASGGGTTCYQTVKCTGARTLTCEHWW